MDKKKHTSTEIIRIALREKGMTYSELADALGEKRMNVVSAVRLTRGLGEKSINIRKRICETLRIDPLDAFSESQLKIPSKRDYQSIARPKVTEDSEDPENWNRFSSTERYQILMAKRGIKPGEFAKELGITYSGLMNHVYEYTQTDGVRLAIAERLGVDPSYIWPKMVKPDVSLKVLDIDSPLSKEYCLRMMGFGNLLEPAPKKKSESIKWKTLA